jgi:hypothetical protein
MEPQAVSKTAEAMMEAESVFMEILQKEMVAKTRQLDELLQVLPTRTDFGCSQAKINLPGRQGPACSGVCTRPCHGVTLAGKLICACVPHAHKRGPTALAMRSNGEKRAAQFLSGKSCLAASRGCLTAKAMARIHAQSPGAVVRSGEPSNAAMQAAFQPNRRRGYQRVFPWIAWTAAAAGLRSNACRWLGNHALICMSLPDVHRRFGKKSTHSGLFSLDCGFKTLI